MQYEVLYDNSYSLAILQLAHGEQVMAESGAMVAMSPTIRLEAKAAGGGMLGALKSAVGGETLFRTTFTAESRPQYTPPEVSSQSFKAELISFKATSLGWGLARSALALLTWRGCWA